MDQARILDAVMKLGVLVFSLCLHEFGHAYAAYRLGDPTAKMLGRMTIDPRAHVDPVGTILFPLMMFLYPGPFLFGWAKPVPVTVENLNKPRTGWGLGGISRARHEYAFGAFVLWYFGFDGNLLLFRG